MTQHFHIAEGLPFKWTDVCTPEPGELEKVAKHYGLHPYTVRDCLEPGHLPKFEALQGVSFIILRSYRPKNDRGGDTVQDLTTKVAIFYNNDLLLTVHRQPVPFLDEIREKYVSTGRSDAVSEVVTKILWFVLHSYEAPVQELADQVDEYESAVFLAHPPRDFQEKCYYLKRKASVTRRVLELTGDIIHKIDTTPDDHPSLQDARDLHIKLLTAYAQMREDVNSLLNIHLSLSAQRTNDVMKVLTIFSAFFLPLTFIAGIYGMNFEFMPELKSPVGYYLCLGAMGVVCILIFIWFKRKRWL
jgi:magnesium transporter